MSIKSGSVKTVTPGVTRDRCYLSHPLSIHSVSGALGIFLMALGAMSPLCRHRSGLWTDDASDNRRGNPPPISAFSPTHSVCEDASQRHQVHTHHTDAKIAPRRLLPPPPLESAEGVGRPHKNISHLCDLIHMVRVGDLLRPAGTEKCGDG
eukprot:353508-Chlamydomonas_euryale.AAC.2